MARPKKQINPDGYYTICNWMVTELGLSGNELLVYAYIYAYSTNENGKGCYFGGYEAMSLAVGCGTKTLHKVTQALSDKGLIEKKKAFLENGLERNYFRVCTDPLKRLSSIESTQEKLLILETFEESWDDITSLSKAIKSVGTPRVF